MTNRLAISALALLTMALPAHAEPRKHEAFEVAVDKALTRLKDNQNPDGSWNSGGGPRDPAVTALCVMAFLSAGHVPGEGPYAATVEKGVRYVCSQQQRNGVFASQQIGNTVMYSHGICTLMVAEVIGLLPDRREASDLRQRLTAAVQLIRAAQCQREGEGGWRYSKKPADADMSVTAWQIMALRAAKNVGCDVPPTVIDRAVEYVNNCRDRNTGGYRYTRGGNVTIACTGASVLSLELCGKEYHKSQDSMDATNYVLGRIRADIDRAGPAHVRFQQHFFYGVYYTAQAMFQIGGKTWEKYREYLHWLLLNPEGHPQSAGGDWRGVSGDDHMAGPNYCTAMAVLALTVEYRFLPIYQRGEEPDERGDK